MSQAVQSWPGHCIASSDDGVVELESCVPSIPIQFCKQQHALNSMVFRDGPVHFH